MLPVPKDQTFTVPDQGEDAFLDLSAPEDEALLATGEWDDDPDDQDEGEQAENIDDDDDDDETTTG